LTAERQGSIQLESDGCQLVIRVVAITAASKLLDTDLNFFINPLKDELIPICYLLALLGARHFFHVSRIRVKSLTLRLLMSYIYIYIYIYNISNLRVNTSAHCSGRKQVKG